MTKREQEILIILKENPLIAQQELANMLGIKRSSVGVHLSNLLKKGYLKGKGYIINEAPYLVVLGGANVDIVGFTDVPLVLKDSNQGTLKISMGGVGRNIAENLVRLGLNTKLILILFSISYHVRMLAKKTIQRVYSSFNDDRSVDELYIKIFLSLTMIYSMFNTFFMHLSSDDPQLFFNLSYTIAFIILNFIAHKRLISTFNIILVYELLLFYAIMIGYMISTTLVNGLIFIIVFSLITIFLNHTLKFILLWLTLYYGVFILINVLNLSHYSLSIEELVQIVVLHIFTALTLGFYMHINRLKSRLLNMKHIKLQKNKIRLNQMNKEITRLNKILEKKSTIDYLTQVQNRRRIMEVLETKIQENSFTLIMVDIDFFKQINDKHGHLVGDHVLKELAAFLKQYIHLDDAIGRYGGEEFLIILNEENIELVEKFLMKLLKNIAQQHFNEKIKVTVSMGVTKSKKDDSIESLIERADIALYKAKEGGRNRYIVNKI